MSGVLVVSSAAAVACLSAAGSASADSVAYNSESLHAGMADSSVASVFVMGDMVLSPAIFSFRSPVNISTNRSLTVFGCGARIDVNSNWTRHSVVVGEGGKLALRGLSFDNTPAMNQLFWPRGLAALLGWVDAAVAGSCSISSCNISCTTPTNLVAYMDTLASSSPTSNFRPLYNATGPDSIRISSWTVPGSSWIASPGISTAAAAAGSWVFADVNVTSAPPGSCVSSTGVPGIRVTSGKEFRQLISDPLLPSLQLVNDIAFVASEWPPEASGPAGGQVFVNGTKEVYACHPTPGERYTIDFGNLGQVIFVFGTLRFRGTILMTNPRASPRRSWLYLLIGALSVETDGVIGFEGVEIRSNVTSPFTNADDPFWSTACGSLCPSFIPDKQSYRNVSYYEAFIYDYRFYKTDWVFVSQGRNITGAGFWGYTDVALTWRPDELPPPAGSDDGGGVPAAAIAVPVAVGTTLLLAVLAFLLYRHRKRRGPPGAKVDASGVGLAELGAAGLVKVSHSTSGPKDGSQEAPAPGSGSATKAPPVGGSTMVMSQISILSGSVPTEVRIEDMKRVINSQAALAATARSDQITLMELLGEGTFGKVYRGTWRGTTVAVKTMVFPSNMSGKEKREKMAVMETAISSSLSHPNIVQTYTYAVLPVKGDAPAAKLDAGHSVTLDTTAPLTLMNSMDSANVHSWEVRLVLEYCDRGSLRDALNAAVGPWQAAQAARPAALPALEAAGAAAAEPVEADAEADAEAEGQPQQHSKAAEGEGATGGGSTAQEGQLVSKSAADLGAASEAHDDAAHDSGDGLGADASGLGGGTHGSVAAVAAAPGSAADGSVCALGYGAVLDTMLDCARAMLHMHSENIVHGDLKARNILLKSGSGGDGRSFVAKVADFGLSLRIDPHETHVSNVYQGTITHMAPECLLHGKVSKMSDVYAFGILMWEAFTAGQPFKGTPRALLGHEVTKMNRRPPFPDKTPFEYQLLACRCWESDPSIRPDFEDIIRDLTRMRSKLGAPSSLSVGGPGAPPGSAAGTAAGGGPSAVGMAGAGLGGAAAPAALQGGLGASGMSGTGGATDSLADGTGGGWPAGPMAGTSSAAAQELFYVQGIDGSTMSASAGGPAGWVGATNHAPLPAHLRGFAGGMLPMPPILETHPSSGGDAGGGSREPPAPSSRT